MHNKKPPATTGGFLLKLFFYKTNIGTTKIIPGNSKFHYKLTIGIWIFFSANMQEKKTRNLCYPFS